MEAKNARGFGSQMGTFGAGSQTVPRRTQIIAPLPLYSSKGTRIHLENRNSHCKMNRTWTVSSSNIHRNKDYIPSVSPKAPSVSRNFSRYQQQHHEGTTPRLHCQKDIVSHSRRPNEAGSSQTDQEIIVIREKRGKDRLLPIEPVLSFEFTEYLLHLNNKEPESIIELKQKPPILLDTFEKSSARPKNTSYCFITTEDLNILHKEIDKIVTGWSNKEKKEFLTNKNSSIQLLSLQHYLTNQILAAKEKCIQKNLKKLQMEAQDNGDSLSLLSSYEKKAKISEMDELGRTLFWQANVFRDMYRQSILTPFMVEKRKRMSLSASRKRMSAAISPDAYQQSQPQKKPSSFYVNSKQTDSRNYWN